MAFTAGDRVTVRGERWVVQEATAFADATLLDSPAPDDRQRAHRRCCLLLHSTARSRQRAPPGIRATTRRRWMRHLHAQQSASARVRRAAGAAAAPRSTSCRFSSSRRWRWFAGTRRDFCWPTKSASARRFRPASCSRSCSSAAGASTRSSSRRRGFGSSGPTSCGIDSSIRAAVMDAASLAALTRGAAVRRESVDRRARRHYVDRFPQAARGAARARRTDVGHADRRRGASGDRRRPSVTRPSTRWRRARGTSCCSPRRLMPATIARITRCARSAMRPGRRSTVPIRFFSFAGRGNRQACRDRAACICCR